MHAILSTGKQGVSQWVGLLGGRNRHRRWTGVKMSPGEKLAVVIYKRRLLSYNDLNKDSKEFPHV